MVDIRDEGQLENAVQQTVDRFGGIDIVVNNASAIHLSGTVNTPMKRSVYRRGLVQCFTAYVPCNGSMFKYILVCVFFLTQIRFDDGSECARNLPHVCLFLYSSHC